MPLKIGAAYIRVSSDDQTEYSPDSQLKLIRDYASREGYVVPDDYVFQDDGISGKTASKRPAFRLMVAQAKADPAPFDSIFVWKFSRFARNQEEAIMYKNLLRKKGISVRSISEPSSDSPFSGLIERIIEWMDEYYLINLATEVRRGMAEKATRGEAMGTAPYGYTVKNKTFVPNEHADTVRYIFSEYAAGKGCRALAQELSEKGVRTRRGNIPDNRWVQYILGNPAYIGKIRWSTDGHANYSRANYDDSNVLLVDGKHPPIIDLEIWDAVQVKLKGVQSETKYIRRDAPRVFALKGLLRCGSCGATLVYLSTKSPTVQCHRYARGQCRVSHSISLAKANATVIAALESVVEGGNFVFAPPKQKKNKIVHDWARLISTEEGKLVRAREALLAGAFTPEEYKDIKAEIEATIARLRDGQRAEEQSTSAPVDLAAYTEKVKSVLEIVKSPDASEGAKNEALRSILEKIVYNKDPLSFDLFFI